MSVPIREARAGDIPFLTWLLCLVSVGMTAGFWFVADPPNSGWGSFSAPEIWAGRYGALISTTFLHGDIIHLLFNMLWLVRLGDIAERTFGHLEFAIFFLVAASVASGTELAIFGHTGIGMSGFVYALFGLVWGARRMVPAFGLVATDDTVRFMLGWLVLCIVLTMAGVWRIANGAHVGGLLFGLASAWLFVNRPARPARLYQAGALLLALVVLTVLSVTWMPWNQDWRLWHTFFEGINR